LIAVLDYGIGNLRSAEKSLQKVGADARLVTDPDEARVADGVVLPGVGAFGRCMEQLRSSGLDQVAIEVARSGRPFLGVCVGMQMLYEASEESPGVRGLGILEGLVRELPDGVKKPQMQWNILQAVKPNSPVLMNLGERPWMYFLHSFAPDATDDVVATCDYGGSVVAAVQRGAVWATQFHPEKSGASGLQLMRNFVDQCGAARARAAPQSGGC
jgi:imidazole glycerol-phosphate synthase subunit HisH